MKLSKDTIYAPASGTQKSGVMIVRVSGPRVLEVAQTFTIDALEPRHATLTDIYHPTTKQMIDKAIIIFYKGPNSFTGEDVLELHIHGSRVVLKLVLDGLASIVGLRLAEPGEFAFRGFMNGKMDLTQVEGLADLIDAETEAQHIQSLKQMSGELRKVYETWRSGLIKIMSKVEAFIDFPDDVPESAIDGLQTQIDSLASEIGKHLSDERRGEKLREGMHIAIIGPANAGKSSIMNRLAGRDVAIVSHIAGTTRDVIEVHLNIKGYPVVIADTAGIRESIDEVENEGIRRSLQRASNADLKIIVIDANDTDGEDKVIGLIDENTIVVVNKIDLSSQKQGYLNERSEFREPCYLGPQATGQEQNCTRSQIVRVSSPLREQETLTSGMTISLSAKENIGIDELLTKISNFTEQFFSNSSSQPLITRERYRTNLSACASTLQALDLTQDLVLVAEDLRMAAQALGRITGEIDVETVLDEIFLSFCIGK